MNFLGIGIPEIIFFVLIMLIILGPTDMVKVGRTLGTSIRKIMTSPTWRMIFSTSNTLRNLPNALAREAGVEELRQELKRETENIKKMGKDIQDAATINLPKPTPLPDSLKPPVSPPTSPTPSGSPNDFSGWTTPIAEARPTPTSENSMLPPHLSNSSPEVSEPTSTSALPSEETPSTPGEPPSSAH